MFAAHHWPLWHAAPDTDLLLVQVLEIKIQKLEQLLQIKNAKIQTLLDRLQASGV